MINLLSSFSYILGSSNSTGGTQNFLAHLLALANGNNLADLAPTKFSVSYAMKDMPVIRLAPRQE